MDAIGYHADAGHGERLAIERLRAIVGRENVVTDSAELEHRSKDTTPSVKPPLAFVYPGSVEEVQAVVRVAGEFKIPLWPVSTGLNWGYGAASAVRAGSVIMVLRRMNRILEVNEELAYAVVEPGVTYRRLNDHLKEKGVGLWLDCTDGPPNGSVMGNALDRGVGVSDYSDHFAHLCGMEVVLPTGELVRTGGGTMAGCKTWNVHKWGTGPYLEGLFTQSNFGIVTKVGLWLMPAPEAFSAFMLELDDESDLPALFDALRGLALRRIVSGGCHVFNDVVGFAIMTQYPPEILESRGHLSDDKRAELRERFGVAPWSVGGSLCGTAAQVRANRAAVERVLGRFGKLEFFDERRVRVVGHALSLLRKVRNTPVLARPVDMMVRKLTGKPFEALEVVPHLHSILQGVPSTYFVRHAYFKSRTPKPDTHVDPARDDVGLMWFAPIAPMSGRHVREVLGLCEPLFRGSGFDFYVALLMQNPRAVIALMSIMYLKEDPDEVRRATNLFDELARVTARAGYQQYRTSVAYMDRVLEQAPEFKSLAERLKSAIDPDGIIAPGKYGVG